jgi:CRP/FNR family transcriptional regulator, cyclic AMP receptor protein
MDVLTGEEIAVESLRSSPLFARVPDETLAAVARTLRRRRFRRGEVIFHQGDLGNSLQIVVSGAVKIVLPSAEGDEAIIATLRPGDFLGELALLDGAPHSASATTLEPTETLDLPRDAFLRLLETDAGLQRALLTALASELRRLTGHVEELHFLDLADRLAKQIVRIAREQYPNAVGSVELDWPFTQSDLAAMIGGTRQSVNKLLSGLVESGVLRIDRDRLVINDLERLEAETLR